MRISDKKLAFKALCVVSEAAAQCRNAPVKGTLGLRFALAYLYATSKTDERRIYDDFWQLIQSTPKACSEPHSQYLRVTNADTYIKAMVRHQGFDQTPEFYFRLAESHKDGAKNAV